MPEVVQTSMMDCGPSSLKAILEGIGIPINLGRLREACHTDVDGTSIDVLEDILVQVGVDAEQVVIPVDHLFSNDSVSLPALLVVRLPDGNTHFVVAWKRHGKFVQIMDPAVGRRWMPISTLIKECYQVEIEVAAKDWYEWAVGSEFLGPLRERLHSLGLSGSEASRLVTSATDTSNWMDLAVLDAATRLSDALRREGKVKTSDAIRVLRASHEMYNRDAVSSIPDRFWFVRPVSHEEDQVLMRGAVLVRIRGVADPDSQPTDDRYLSDDLCAALTEPTPRPFSEFTNLLKLDGLLTPLLLSIGIGISSAAIIAEALLFRAMLTPDSFIDGSNHQLMLYAGTLALVALLFFVEIPIASFVLRVGRKLENRMRIALLEKIPRLGDRYFSSRLVSDIAERSHSMYQLRHVAITANGLLASASRLFFVVVGISWLDTYSAPLAIMVATISVGIPLLMLPILTERNLRVRTHLGSLSRYYLDCFLGLFTIRAHGAEKNVSIGHQSRLTRWMEASRSFLKLVVAANALNAVLVTSLIVWIVFAHYQRNGESAAVLLLVYWLLQIPYTAQQISGYLTRIPSQRNVVQRLLEPLSAPEIGNVESGLKERAPICGAAKIEFTGVSVVAGGHKVLTDINLSLQPGEHVAMVGNSGAGKSSLIGALLGWNKIASGLISVDGLPISQKSQQVLRESTAWLDPSVQLWNDTLLRNVRYGFSNTQTLALDQTIEMAGLIDIVDHLPYGMQTVLGEGGGLLSGGEGQRIRFARALNRQGARLVIFDEPFRGLPKPDRLEFLDRARAFWRQATFLCISHDLDHILEFPRVVVVEDGAIIQDGKPSDLLNANASRLKEMVDTERLHRTNKWSQTSWRSVRMVGGVLTESSSS